ncbi:MAG TPA: TetR/AcrR family transcriptional regulator [Solirubrobacterales bacterium]|jgi:AcrR family transcriptional regulator|nr:TetR/AcrR family transcriptional regulator [Solirubrobacterales bacterium]
MTPRAYTQSKRADATERTRRAILDATQSLFREERLAELPLERIAARASCSSRSILRHFGSREGLMSAAIADAEAETASTREAAPGDVPGAIRKLVDHYEQSGDEVIRWIAAAESYPLVRQVVESGERLHLDWVDAVFADDLAALRGAARRQRRAVLASVTDVYVWQLLRRRGRLGRDATEAAMLDLVEHARRGR